MRATALPLAFAEPIDFTYVCKPMKWVLFVLAVTAVSAHADSTVSPSIDARELAAAIEALPVQLDEPIGLVALSRNPRLGLEKGDVIRAINGTGAIAAHSWFSADAPITYLDVVRGRKAITIRLQVKLPSATDKLERHEFKDRLDLIAQRGVDGALGQVTRNGEPSGVLVRSVMLFDAVHAGDVIRKVDGVAIDKVDRLLAALTTAADHSQVVLEIDRLGQPIVATLTILEDLDPEISEGIAKIKMLNDTTYELPRSLVDAVLDHPMAVARAARIVPAAMKDGQPAGFKIYAIRPRSVFAALGFLNGDTLIAIDGIDLTTPDKALGWYEKLRTATELTVQIERRQVPVTLSYKIK
jgi:S1-C subfamily serine protease